jgi:ABC-2 type transport system permease protein
MTRPVQTVRQTIAFARKDLSDAARQPRLLVTLVLGPFLVMAAFGLGYRDTPPALRAAVVAGEDSVFRHQVDAYADDLGESLDLVAVTSDVEEASRLLAAGEVDLVVTFPDDPLASVMDGEHAVVEVSHTRLDPIERTGIGFATDLAVDQVNGHILALLVRRGQEVARPTEVAVETVRAAIALLDDAAGSGDADRWAEALERTTSDLRELDDAVRASSTVAAELGSPDARDALDRIHELVLDLRGSARPTSTTAATIEELRTSVDAVAERFVELTTIDAGVLVRPLIGEVRLAVAGVDRVTDWYAPAAVVLILQQFGTAFGALSFVRERQLGINEVFRVAPVGAIPTVLGKYIAHLFVGSVVGAVLMTGVVLALGVPFAGRVADLAVALALSLVASIGLGLAISLVSGTDAQAVQYTMIVLLASLFFSGFFLSVGQMAGPARAVSAVLPVTYGMEMLRDVMLRGAGVQARTAVLLGAYATVMFGIVLAGASRRMAATRA